MTLRAVTSADLSWELTAIIYSVEIYRAKLIQFSRRKKDVASSTYFQLKIDYLMEKLCFSQLFKRTDACFKIE